MAPKSITISARIAQEDAEFLSQLTIEGATTLSDKLRALITDARQRQRPRDYAGCLRLVQEMTSPVATRVRQAEREAKMHSELVTHTVEWLPEMLAFLIADAPEGGAAATPEQLKRYEKGLADRLFRMVGTLLRLAITPQHVCYQADSVSRHMAPVLDLSSVLLDQSRT